MRFSTLLLSIAMAFGSVHASINNKATAAALQLRAEQLKAGAYMLTNVGNGMVITQTRDNSGNHIFPAKGATSYLNLRPYSAIPNYIIMQGPLTNNKCISAQWDVDYDQGADWAGSLYACQVDPVPATSTLNPNKQYWLFVESQTIDNAYYIIPVDHLLDMATRGLQGCTRATHGYKSVCLDELDLNDPMFMWYVTPQGSSVPTQATTKAVTTTPAKTTVQPTSIPTQIKTPPVVSPVINASVPQTVTVTKTVTSTATQTVVAYSRNCPVAKVKLIDMSESDAELNSIGSSWFGRWTVGVGQWR